MADRLLVTRRWSPGDTIVHQEVWRGKLWAARPLTVVEDSPDRLMLWCPRGTIRTVPVTPPTRAKASTRAERIVSLLDRCDWVLEEREWDVSTLWLLEPSSWHAVWVSWLPDGQHWGWYINFQEPFHRTERGFRAIDLMLDILVEKDLTWRWKDEDEFEVMIGAKLYDEVIEERVRAEAREVIRRIESNERPFNEPWSEWRSPAEWEIPILPRGWEEIDGVKSWI